MSADQNIYVYRTKKSAFDTYVRYPLEFVGAVIFCAVFRILPLDWASALCGFIVRHVGPHMGVSWVARYNMMKVFPEKTPAEIDALVVKMWDNMGRTFGEYPHLRALTLDYEKRIEIRNPERLRGFAEDGKPGIVFSGHIGNWEMSSVSSRVADLAYHRIYRFANNPLVEWLFVYFRGKIKGDLLPKGKAGMRRIVQRMNEGGHLALLVDQKMNDGISVPFFGFEAMTTPALARLALKYDCPLLPMRSERLKGAHFRLTAEEFLSFEKTGNMKADSRALMMKVNGVLERWIREAPEQWLWVHKRWPDSNMGAMRLCKDKKLWKKGIKPPELFKESQEGRIKA